MNKKNELTPKELQLLKLIAKDYSRKQAAVALDIKITTVDTHLISIHR